MKIESNRIDEVVKKIFCEYCGNDTPSFTEALIFQGCDSLDTIEIAMAIEEDLEIEELDDEFVERMIEMSIEQIIKELQLKFN
jgi:acyl carrier protein